MIKTDPTTTATHHDVDPTAVLRVTEFFVSLQGEGADAGRRTAFIRLAGCNLTCTWCDTPYSWQPGVFGPAERQPYTIAALLQMVADAEVESVEVTGGEPLLQSATPSLLVALCDAGYQVSLDTSGAVPCRGQDSRVRILLDYKCPTSGQSGRMVRANLPLLRPGRDELKFVIADRTDFEWAEQLLAAGLVDPGVRVVYSPVTPRQLDFTTWSLPRELAGWMLASRSRATLQLQLHRLLWPEAVRGTEEGR